MFYLVLFISISAHQPVLESDNNGLGTRTDWPSVVNDRLSDQSLGSASLSSSSSGSVDE